MKKEERIVVWDFFGGLNGSVSLAISNKKYKVYTFDIREKTKQGKKNIVLDLANENINEIFKILDKYPKPNIITSSPMCMSFSTASGMKGSGASGWDKNKNGTIYIRPKEDYLNTRINYKRANFNALIGKRAIENTLKIIDYYEPKYWYIENPHTSLMWSYIFNNLKWREKEFLYMNECHYGAYDHNVKKPTIFLSNTYLFLKKTNKDFVATGYISDNPYFRKKKKELNLQTIKKEDRSNIPKELIKEIFEMFK